ncbi:MAG: hypothetical protein ACREO5_07240 [Candidatus Binatia bacterium]
MFRWLTSRKKPKKGTVDPQAVTEIVRELLTLQRIASGTDLMETYPDILTNALAMGYVFGFVDAFMQRYEITNPNNHTASAQLMRAAYQNIFDEQSGGILFDMSIASQTEQNFHHGRMVGGNEAIEFLRNGTPQFGLDRILMGLRE